MDILKEYEYNINDIGVYIDEYLLNQKLNELFIKARIKIQDDNLNMKKLNK